MAGWSRGDWTVALWETEEEEEVCVCSTSTFTTNYGLPNHQTQYNTYGLDNKEQIHHLWTQNKQTKHPKHLFCSLMGDCSPDNTLYLLYTPSMNISPTKNNSKHSLENFPRMVLVIFGSLLSQLWS